MAKWKDDEIKIVKKGFNYFCHTCFESFRYKSLVEKIEKGGMWIWLTCPKCGEIVTDLKRK